MTTAVQGREPMDLQAAAPLLASQYPRLAEYEYNEHGAPLLKGLSFWDMGLYLLIVELMGDDSNSENLQSLLSVKKLTCKNWIEKHRQDTQAQIEWSFRKGREVTRGRYQVTSWGILTKENFLPLAPYLTTIIERWKQKRHEQ